MVSRALSLANHTLSSDKLSGVPRLIEDLHKLSEDRETTDLLFLVAREETPLYGHKILFRARCLSFQNLKRAEVCKVPGTTVSPAPPGTPNLISNSSIIRWPQANADVVREVFLYVYTGKIALQHCNVCETLAIAGELGLEELIDSSQEYIQSSISVHNACSFLSSAIKLETRLPEKSDLIKFCTSFVGENAIECVKTPTFLNLSKEALIHLVSSDYLALEEADVFRATLNWAKHKAGVLQPTHHWTEEERARICQQLSGVINHIRILLIDSQVFAEEVEPTGAVPIELSLERYRFAALPNKFQNSEDKRVQPRISLRLFQGSQLLSGDKSQFQSILNHWYGCPKQTWKLIYRASTHGYSADAFHQYCDGQSPTFVLILGSSGHLCGGFSDVPWAKTCVTRGRYMASDKAFLFTLLNSSDIPPTKFSIVKKMFAIAHHSDYGPVFGAGADLSIANNCNTNCESYSNLPHTYEGDNASNTVLMGHYNFTAIDYEVFTTIT
ncbi:uncharacterized protein LOC128965417 [Oppia nitens]|uniref:uncharacterized protein LOC128965417 n=1 Tax=Oppia nitens TaxID=1686743 RepID=UPI0023DCD829|nr:uncharacterized protein LOC128965417 [Oppia nitens]